MADAMEMMILSILAPALHCDWLLNEWQKALITMVRLRNKFKMNLIYLNLPLPENVFQHSFIYFS